jgi:hypothetical protein
MSGVIAGQVRHRVQRLPALVGQSIHLDEVTTVALEVLVSGLPARPAPVSTVARDSSRRSGVSLAAVMWAE